MQNLLTFTGPSSGLKLTINLEQYESVATAATDSGVKVNGLFYHRRAVVKILKFITMLTLCDKSRLRAYHLTCIIL
jgi:hypothetical protein